MKPNNIKSFKKNHNYAFQYKQFAKKTNKGKKKFKAIMLYLLILIGRTKYILKDRWMVYEFKNQNNFQNKAQRHEHKHVISQNNKRVSKEKLKIQTQELKENYHKRFVNGSEKSYTCIFYNYYCRICHISLDCKHKKRNNIIKYYLSF
jgi:hypothetical protein